ncbi:MAG: hypothetical protein MMC33_001930 [Icmadophila ericetorum]|nr:hypothetical protein [Icmadophila ericetorum]
MVPSSKDLFVKPNISDSLYQLDRPQTLKASTALLKHIKSASKHKETIAAKKNLLAGGGESDSDENEDLKNDPIFLTLATKKYVTDKTRLKPGKINLPHPIYDTETSSICLITTDPQREVKDAIAHPTFPPQLGKHITRVIGMSKLKAKYSSYESRRQLLSEHDVFLADDRIITRLPKTLGKVFYQTTSKRPMPVTFQAPKPQGPKKSAGTSQNPSEPRSLHKPELIAREIEKALSCAQVYMATAATTSVRVGLASFTPKQLAENVATVVDGMIEKFIPQKWRNVRAIHIKGQRTAALPIWLPNELWVEEKDILEDEEAADAIAKVNQKEKKRKAVEGGEAAEKLEKKVKLLEVKKEPKKPGNKMSKEMLERREKLRKQKQEAREEASKEVAVF